MVIPLKSLPPLNALRAFEVSGRQLSFRRASEELGVSQGAVAQQVRLLEDHLGFSLFRRLPRGIALTARGASYHSEIARAFETLRKATDEVQHQAEAVTISVTPTFASKVLMPRLPALGAALPDVDLRIVATVAVSDFDRDRVDIAVRETRPPFPTSLESHLLFRENLVAVASPHLVGDLPPPLTHDEVRGLPLLHDSYDHWPRFFDHAGRLPGAVFNQVSLALDAALAGQGAAIACRAFVQTDIDAGRLIEICRADFSTGSDYYLLRKHQRQPRDRLDAVWSWCLANFASG
ncbi:LysR family transcriptional regulator [Sulfitobacter sp. BDSS02]|uniref:LysR substrate-binding domain-containing protein n=1 Tax=Heliomarina sp. TaxID=2917556 RepID=UPI004059DE07|nr:LysR family transcriptional regulator [Sulfitobacter sp. BDSS02]MBR9848443.1 LysR family transcriptional regulator [Paracoccaceae bacterium]